MSTFALLKTIMLLILPPASLAVAVVLAAVLALFGWWRLGRWLVALAIVELLVLSFPPAADAMIRYLEDHARAAELATPRCCFDAIVVLGGGMAPATPPEQPFPRLVNGADRVWLAALAKLDATPFPTDFRSLRSLRATWDNWIFSGDALDLSITALREIIALNLDVRARALGE
jgi:uncharacterized SAM-binding protein YcdF (DUF218 family)